MLKVKLKAHHFRAITPINSWKAFCKMDLNEKELHAEAARFNAENGDIKVLIWHKINTGKTPSLP